MSLTDWQLLIDAALAVRLRAYAPYSRFQVGAAVMADDGEVFIGGNVENGSYGLTICAERAAIFAAVAAGVKQFRAIAIATHGGLPPCGACRQVMAEFCEDLPVLLVDAANPSNVTETSLKALLPGKFVLPE